jgi:hypothetical protein
MAIDRIAPDFFTGVEVENSPAKGMLTLFVVGLQPASKVLEYLTNARSYNDKSKHINHVYIGANMSLHHVENDDHHTWRMIDDLIESVLSDLHVHYVTVDILLNQVEGFLESTASDEHRVIPMISAKLPYTRLLNYNTTVKIDDKGFNKTNPGVWCVPLGDLTQRKYFTPWIAYQGDSPIN